MSQLTDGDRKLLVLVWQCFKSPPQVDYNKLKELGGYKTSASANTAYYDLRKKLLTNSDGTNGLGAKPGASATPKPLRKGGKKRAAAELALDAADMDDSEDETLRKAAIKGEDNETKRGKKPKIKREVTSEDYDDEATVQMLLAQAEEYVHGM